MEAEIFVKTHESYRKVVAACDSDLIGRYFEQGNLQLDVKKEFYNGEKKAKSEVIKLLKKLAKEDATFNIVGKDAVDAAIKAGIISKKGVSKIQKIPYALSLL